MLTTKTFGFATDTISERNKDELSKYLSNPNRSKDKKIELLKVYAEKLKAESTYYNQDQLLSLYAYFEEIDAFDVFKDIIYQEIETGSKKRSGEYLTTTHVILSQHYERKKLLDSAYYYLNQAHKKLQSKEYDNQRKNIAFLHLKMSIIQEKAGDYINAENNVVQAVFYYEKLKDTEKIFMSYTLLGIIQNRLRDFQEAIMYHNKAADQLDNFDDINQANTYTVINLNNKASVYLQAKKYKRAKNTYKELNAKLGSTLALNNDANKKALLGLSEAELLADDKYDLPRVFENIDSAKAMSDKDNLDEQIWINKLYSLAHLKAAGHYKFTNSRGKSIEFSTVKR